jgi:hypothetical protein
MPHELNELFRVFKAPEIVANTVEIDASAAEKRDVFSLGVLMYYLLNREICPVVRQTSAFPIPFAKSRKKNADPSAAMSVDSKPHSILMERMTSYEAAFRPSLKEVIHILSSGLCKFGILPENVQTGERYKEIVRSFAGNDNYKFTPEKEYVFNCVTVAPLSCEPMLIPFRLVKKQYVLEVAYGGEGRWHCVQAKKNAPSIEPAKRENAVGVPKLAAALHFCDAVYGIDGDTVFCDTDGYSYEIGLYEYSREDKENKRIKLVRDGNIAVPERLEARVLSLLREVGKSIHDLRIVVVYGNMTAAVVKAINDMFPEAIRIYRIDDDDILKGAALYLEHLERKNSHSKKEELAHEV